MDETSTRTERVGPRCDTEKFTIRGELEYEGPGPALPANAVMIERGDLEGRVLVSENVGVRQLQFEGDGVVTDLGALDFGDGLDQIVGVIGVQP